MFKFILINCEQSQVLGLQLIQNDLLVRNFVLSKLESVIYNILTYFRELNRDFQKLIVRK